MTLRKPLTIVVSALAALTMLAGCSSSGGSGEDFCTQGEKIMNVDQDDPEALAAAMKKLADVAPADIKDDLKYLADVYSKMAGIDMEDEAALMEAMKGEDMGRMMEVAASVPTKLEELCGK